MAAGRNYFVESVVRESVVSRYIFALVLGSRSVVFWSNA